LMAMAKKAEASRVSLTIVMDACFSGAAVPAFQDHAADTVDQGIDRNVEGKGRQSSADNHEKAERLKDRMMAARELILESAAISSHGDAIDKIVRGMEFDMPSTPADWQEIMAENAEIQKLVKAIEGQFEVNMNGGDLDKDLSKAISDAIETVETFLYGVGPTGKPFVYRDWSGAIGRFTDTIGDSANKIIEMARAQSS